MFGLLGSTSVVVLDQNGDPFTINFSRPTDVEIYLELDLETDDDFPTTGIQDVEDAVLAYGAALRIGQDVIVIGSESLTAAVSAIPGITDIVTRIGTAPGPTLDDNIVIQPNEIAAFDSTRITVVELP